MIKIFYKLLLFVPFVFFVVMLNIYIDPGLVLTRNVRIKKIAQLMSAGKNVSIVAIPSAASFLTLKKMVAESIYLNNKQKLDIAILGSSRSSEICSHHFPGKKIFNFSVGRAHLADYIEIYDHLKTCRIKPDIAIIGIDPWIGESIDSDSSDNFYSKYLPNFKTNIKPLKLSTTNLLKGEFHRIVEFLSPAYAQSSLKGLAGLLRSHNISPLHATMMECGTGRFVVRSDGSYSLKCPSTIYDEQVKNLSIAFANKNKGHYFGKQKIANGQFKTVFEAFVQQLQEDGIKPILFIAPLQPAAFDILSKWEPNLVEEYFKSVAKNKNISIIGSFKPNSLKEGKQYFIDQYHPSGKAITKIFENFNIDDLKTN